MDEEIKLRKIGRYFRSYMSNSEITVAWIIEKLNLQLQTWNESCLKYAGTVNIVSVNDYVLVSIHDHKYRHPSCNFNPIQQMSEFYNELFKVCQIIAKETPILAIELLRQYINELEFDVLYENANILLQIWDKIPTTLSNSYNQEIIGKFREHIVLDCSFLEYKKK